MLHGQRAAERVSAQRRAAAEGDPDRVVYLERAAELIGSPSPEGVYICCFCLRDDLLSQWRSYGANGTGVSIQIAPDSFSYVCGPDSPHGGLMRLWKVFYEPGQQSSIIGNLIDIGYEGLRHITNDPRELARHAADAIKFFIPTFKHPDFRRL